MSLSCVVCGSNSVKALRDLTSVHVDKLYTLYSCRSCQSRFFDINQNPIDLDEFYEGYADRESSTYSVEFKSSQYWNNEVYVIRNLSVIPIKSILDVGCRSGDFLMHWPDEISRTGIEISNISASAARERGLNVIQSRLEDVKLDKKFDVVACYAILEHLSAPLEFLDQLPRLVNENAIVSLMIPTWQCLKQKLLYARGKQWHMYCPPFHFNFISRKKLDDEMRSRNFRLVKRSYTSGGMFNPFRSYPSISWRFDLLMNYLERRSLFGRIPFFDHMYSYYMKID